MDPERRKILDKIAALRSKTQAAGCTEEEAMSASSKAAELLDRYGLDESDLRAVKQSDFERADYEVSDAVGERLWRVATAIAVLTDTRSWSNGIKGRPDTCISFWGLSVDVSIAQYLLDICDRAVRSAAARHEASLVLLRPNVRRRRLHAFLDGMMIRLAKRIREIDWTRKRSKGEGSGLVVLKMALVDAGLKGQGIVLQAYAQRHFTDAEPEFELGAGAADQVRLDAGVGTRRAHTPLIGP
ncbi:DUF2786 domain-containing protein [Bosea sp. RAC05]|uniref:DUF2786 domain-containing protein n=1 Tax=Bosea sp. RAC05 TaxID=1842539 RepID=UPI00083D4AC2|nr:DUF2786 domain-containing protein [Bosea sp. RAC05]AOG02913.1 hypothetical protein BSY19_4900 [Bosea sp. RAC05]